MDRLELSKTVSGGHHVLPFEILNHCFGCQTQIVLFRLHVSTDEIADELNIELPILLVDHLKVIYRLLSDSCKLLVMLRRKSQPALMTLTECQIIAIFDGSFYTLLTLHENPMQTTHLTNPFCICLTITVNKSIVEPVVVAH